MGALEEVRDLAEAVARRRSLQVWDVEVGGRPGSSVVRVFVHGERAAEGAAEEGRRAGVDLDTVAQISEEISRGLDLKDPFPGRYTLEVSTPGLERSLKTAEHFARSAGERVVVKTTEVIHDNSHRVEGTLVASGDSSATLRLDSGDEVEVPLSKVKQARTVFEW